MDEARAAGGSGFRHELGGVRVDAQRFVALGFAAVHIGGAGAVDEDVELAGRERLAEHGGIRDIALRAGERSDIVGARPDAGECGGEAAVRAEDENFPASAQGILHSAARNPASAPLVLKNGFSSMRTR